MAPKRSPCSWRRWPGGAYGFNAGFGPENVGFIFPMIYSHLISFHDGIMISKTRLGKKGFSQHFQTHPYVSMLGYLSLKKAYELPMNNGGFMGKSWENPRKIGPI